jgi:hypothetical protein
MNFFLRTTIFFCAIWASPLLSQVHILMTSALIPLQYEQRKQEYLKSFNIIRLFGFDPWIIESTNIDHSFFDQISNKVIYPQKNNLLLSNKGVNETMSLRASLSLLPFKDEDIVIKLTGRYFLYKRFFINLIKKNLTNYDAFVCYGKHFVSKEHIFTGCFAMRWDYFKKIILEMDLEKAEKDYIPVEKIFADFIEENSLRIKKVDHLYMFARIFYAGEGVEVLDF